MRAVSFVFSRRCRCYKALVSRRLMLLLAGAVVVVAAAVVAVMLAVGSSGTVKARWVVHDLGTLPGFHACQATMINDGGQVVGWCNAGTVSHGFLWQQGKLTDLGSTQMLPGPVINGHGQVLATGSKGAFLLRDGRRVWLGGGTEAVAINDRGQVVGDRRKASGESRAFLWQHGKLVDLGTLGGKSSNATAISNRGQVVGYSTTATGSQHAFLWAKGKMIDLGTLGGSVAVAFGGVGKEYFQPTAINDQGQIVGLAHDALGSYQVGWLWQKGKLETLGDFNSQANEARAVNEHGQVLLQTTPPSDKKGDAYLWQSGKLTKLPAFDDDTPATFAYALNNQGQIAGNSLVEIGNNLSFIWQDGRMTPLRSLTGQETAPWSGVSGINNSGEIIGSNYIGLNGQTELHPVLWAPQPRPSS